MELWDPSSDRPSFTDRRFCYAKRLSSKTATNFSAARGLAEPHGLTPWQSANGNPMRIDISSGWDAKWLRGHYPHALVWRLRPDRRFLRHNLHQPRLSPSSSQKARLGGCFPRQKSWSHPCPWPWSCRSVSRLLALPWPPPASQSPRSFRHLGSFGCSRPSLQREDHLTRERQEFVFARHMVW